MAADLLCLLLSPLLALAFLAAPCLALAFALLLRSCIAAALADPLIGRHCPHLLLLPMASTASTLVCPPLLLRSNSLEGAAVGCLSSSGIPAMIPALAWGWASRSASTVPALPAPGPGALAP